MSSKPDLPPISDDLKNGARRRVDLRSIPSTPVDDATATQNSLKLGNDWGAQTSLEPAAPVEAEVRTGPIASLRVEVPDYLDRELAFAAVERRTTKQHLVLLALKQAGYRVDDADLVGDKRRVKRR